jgi:hypothetical protein
MLDTRAQVSLLLERAAELRAQSQEIQRKLRQIFAEIAKLTGRPAVRKRHDAPGVSPQVWRGGPAAPGSSDTHV